MKNELEESWNKYKKELIKEDYFCDTNERAFFQAGFNAAFKLFKENIAKESLYCANCGDEIPKDCPKCLKFAGITKYTLWI